MSYLKEFLAQIHNRDHHKFFILWEEYCTSEQVDVEEFKQLLQAVKSTDSAKHFGQIVETALPLWKLIQDEEASYEILRQLIDLQTTNSPALGEIAFLALQKRHGKDPRYAEKLKIAGLKGKEQFQGALSRYDLASHFEKGKMVFHTGGWGVGEIMDVSFVRENLVIEFENVSGRKDVSFANAFKTLVPLPDTHFLARRFVDADRLEKEGKEDPAALIRLLLRDLGPQTAAGIRDELVELVIPEKDWNKWWQAARGKIKKDPFIETPDSLKEAFVLRRAKLTPEEHLGRVLAEQQDLAQLIQSVYNFVRDYPDQLKDKAFKGQIEKTLTDLLQTGHSSGVKTLEILFLLEQLGGGQARKLQAVEFLQEQKPLLSVIEEMEILAFKKKALVLVRDHFPNWESLFTEFLFRLPQAQLKDYLYRELEQNQGGQELQKKWKQLLVQPDLSPETFVWYFQRLLAMEEKQLEETGLEEEIWTFFEGLFVLMHVLESHPHQKDLVKKIYGMLSGQRYALVRKLLQKASLKYTEEVLLLASKCHTLGGQDMKILRSLAEVVHPSLAAVKPKKVSDAVIWTTEESLRRMQQKIEHIGTVEVVENAREIEEARKHGDLRENSEFKFAQEKRARLQLELKSLAEQLKKARLITPEDISAEEVGVGSVVELVELGGQKSRYTILGPWDADVDRYIISIDSKLAQAMLGKRVGETFSFKEQTLTITNLVSYLD